MAKKKKHRKSNRSRKQRMQATSANIATVDSNANQLETKSVETETPAAKSVARQSKNQMVYDDVELSYVKEDVSKTLVLVGIILAIYAGIWLLMTYTNLGTQISHIFSR